MRPVLRDLDRQVAALTSAAAKVGSRVARSYPDALALLNIEAFDDPGIEGLQYDRRIARDDLARGRCYYPVQLHQEGDRDQGDHQPGERMQRQAKLEWLGIFPDLCRLGLKNPDQRSRGRFTPSLQCGGDKFMEWS